MKLPLPGTLPRFVLTSGFALAVGGTSHAAIVTSLGNPVTVAPPANNVDADTIQFNVGTGQIGLGSQNNVTNPQFRISYPGQFAGKGQMQGVPGMLASVLYTASSDNNYVTNVPRGTLISEASGNFVNGADGVPYLAVNQSANSQFRSGVAGYAGLLIVDPNNPNQADYGWVQITYNADQSITVNGFAYENTGSPIPAGAIPEPGTVATSLLALGGAAGAMVARRRRAAKEVAA